MKKLLRPLHAVLIAAASLLTASSAHAAAFELQSQQFPAQGCGYVVFGAAPLSHSDTCSYAPSGAPNSTVTATRAGVADFGLLGAYVDLQVDFAAGEHQFLGFNSIAMVVDFITVSGGSGSGFLSIDLLLSGIDSGTSASGRLFSGASATASANGVAIWGTSSGEGSFSGLLPFTFGVPFQFQLYLEADSMVGPCSACDTSALAGGSYHLFADYLHTLTLAPLVVLDDSGGRVDGAVVQSDTGYRYAVAGDTPGTVPEPTALALLGSALYISSRRFRRRGGHRQ